MFAMVRDNFRKSMLTAIAAAAVFVAPVSNVHAQYRMGALPAGSGQDLSMPTIVDKAGTQLPLNLEFTTTDGRKVALGSVFNHERPVVVSLVYFTCPFMCGENQNSLVDAVLHGPRNLSLGKDYEIVVVSIDPDDTPQAAKQKHDHYLEMMNRKPTDAGLTYLTGSESNIKELADAIGFGFRRNWTTDNKFVHQPGIFICTPEGKVSHTITGLLYESDELHLRLTEASNGKIGSGFLAFALCCGAMHFNPRTGHYENNPYFWVGTATGVVTILMVGGFLTMLWRTDTRRKVEEKPNTPASEST